MKRPNRSITLMTLGVGVTLVLVALAVRSLSRPVASSEWTAYASGQQARRGADLPPAFSTEFRQGYDVINASRFKQQAWTEADVLDVRRWVFAAPASHPSTEQMSKETVDPAVERTSLASAALSAATARLGHDGPMTPEAREAVLLLLTEVAAKGSSRVRAALPSDLVYNGLVFQFPHLMDMLRSLTNDPDPAVAKNARIHLEEGVPRIRARWEATLAQRPARHPSR